MSRLLYALALSTLMALPAHAMPQDCSGDPGFRLQAPATTPIGEPFELLLEAPAGFSALLLISRDQGPVESPYGPLCVGPVFEGIVPLMIPQTGQLTYPCGAPCEARLVGRVFYGQFLAFEPANPANGGRSNQASMTIVDGICDDTFCSFTQGGWGQECNGQNVGCLRDQHFDAVFPSGLILGDPDGPDGDDRFSLVLPTAAAIEAFLPQGGQPMALQADDVSPTGSAAGVFAGQLAAAKLNVGFDDAGIFAAFRGDSAFPLGDLVFTDCVDDDLIGLSVREVIALADQEISGASTGIATSDLSKALDVLNNHFGECGTSTSCFQRP